MPENVAIPIYALTEPTSKHFAVLIIVTKPNPSTLVILLTITRRKKLKITKLTVQKRQQKGKFESYNRPWFDALTLPLQRWRLSMATGSNNIERLHELNNKIS